jgi:nitrite reductase/ring-hydroxylating ferredoxin subunit
MLVEESQDQVYSVRSLGRRGFMSLQEVSLNKGAPSPQDSRNVLGQHKPVSSGGTERGLPGFPIGWFAVGFSHELPPGGLLSRQFMGHELVVFRTKSGTALAMDAYCPHLGAHFAHGGTIEGEVIRCPFHGFCFNQHGECVATGYGTKPPPTARVRTWPLHEVNGMLMVYHDSDGKEPIWEVPAFDAEGWTSPRSAIWQLRTHPQESTENSVDIGHFSYIHGYQSVEVLSDLVSSGPHLSTRYAIKRPAGLFGQTGQGVRAQFEINVYGLGYSLVETNIPSYGLRTRHVVCATPLEHELMEMRIAVSIHKITKPQQIHPFLWFIPRALINKLIFHFTFKSFVHDLQQDFVIWENKCYIQPPALAAGDGPIGKYRSWVRQFYPETT